MENHFNNTMRYRIKKYHGKMKLKYGEKLQVRKKKMGKWWDRFREKGHEKMTIMFIPHNEKKIFTFQISKFFILFFILLFLVVLMTSSYAVIKNASIKREEQRLLTNYKDVRSILLRFEKNTNSIQRHMNEMKPEIEELYALASGNEGRVSGIWKSIDLPIPTSEEVKLRSILPDEIYALKDLQKDIATTTNTVKVVKNFIDVRTKVINETPSIVPNVGHITSLFGWRRSPFGFGRDWHAGIDIAGPSGSEIRATAPGTVIVSGWSGGYGNLVHLKHKYGFESLYGHCLEIKVKQGEQVKKGQVIATVGMTGSATGNHCHYEIRLGNIAINPYPYMRKVW